MEFIDGRPLSSILKTAGPLSTERAADIGAHTAAALGYAHKHGVVHRDVKPGNVLITDDGQVKVTDFGIARAINTEESLTQTGAVMGTATYFSPEQAEGMGVDARSDIYSLGVVLFEMVTGRPPFLGDTPVAVASKHVRDIPPTPREINPAVQPTFEAIILKAMAKDPSHRYQTAEELRADLLRFNEGRSVLAADDPTVMQAALGTTMAIGAVAGGFDATRAISAQPGQPPEEETKGNRTRNYVLLLVALLILLAVVGYFLARQLGYAGGSSSFSLPRVVGMQVAPATAKLQGDGLTVATKKQVNAGFAPGYVLASSPPENTLVKKGDTVTLTVDEAKKVTKVRVPSVAGLTQSAAETLLQKDGLVVGNLTNQPSTQYSASLVVGTNPAAGTSQPTGTSVDLIVSSGAPAPTTTTTTVPPTTTTTVPPTTTTSTSTTTTTTPSSTTTSSTPGQIKTGPGQGGGPPAGAGPGQ
jgi:eukaryotic-like serine/threonine-protein kinase